MKTEEKAVLILREMLYRINLRGDILISANWGNNSVIVETEGEEVFIGNDETTFEEFVDELHTKLKELKPPLPPLV